MKNKALSIIEFIISSTVVAVLLVMLFGVMAKKAKMITPTDKGTYVCWKNVNNELFQKTFTIHPGGKITETQVQKVENCKIEFSQDKFNYVKQYTVTLIAGGGGGGEPDYNNISPLSLCNYKNIKGSTFYPYELSDNGVVLNNIASLALDSAYFKNLMFEKYPKSFGMTPEGIRLCDSSICYNKVYQCQNFGKCQDKIHDYKLLQDTDTAFAPFGTEGKDGSINVLTNLFLTGSEILIKNEDIASGGNPNNKGYATKFMVKDKNSNNRILKGIADGGEKGKIITSKNQINIQYNEPELPDGDIWQEISNGKIIPKSDSMFIYNTYGKTYTGNNGAYCENSMKCYNAVDIGLESNVEDITKYDLDNVKSLFGKGGGGASSIIKCPYILGFKYTKALYRNQNIVYEDLIENIPSNLSENYFKNANASKGSGGAIIIEWE